MTDFGPFVLHTYRDTIDDRLHLVLVRGTVNPEEPFLVRVHVQNPLSDVLSIQRADFGLPLRTAIAEIASEDSGMVLVLGGHRDDDELLRQIQQVPEPPVAPSGDDRRARELRNYGIGRPNHRGFWGAQDAGSERTLETDRPGGFWPGGG